MNKITIVLFLAVLMVSCESEEVDFRNLQIHAYILHHNRTSDGNYVFKGIPVEFRCELEDTLQKFPDIEVEWDFGDGEFSTLRNCFHTYKENGFIQPSVNIKDQNNIINIGGGVSDGSWQYYYYDYFNFHVTNYPKIIGSKEINEKGEFIFQNQDNSYSVISLFEDELGNKEYHILCFDERLVQIIDKLLSIGNTEKIKKTLKNRNGNIIIITNTKFYEYSPNGEFVNSKDLEIEYSSIIESLDGYIIAGIIGNKLRIDNLNQDGAVYQRNFKEFDIEGYFLKNIFLTSLNSYFVYFNNGIENHPEQSRFIFIKNGSIQSINNLSLSCISDIVFSGDKYYIIGNQIKTFDAVVRKTATIVYEDYFTANGEISDSVCKYITSVADTIKMKKQKVKIINVNNTNVYFYDNMIFEIGDEYTEIIKKYGLTSDILEDVAINNNGNYVMLGTKYDIVKSEASQNSYSADLLLIEVDHNGEIVTYEDK